jgi:ABC-2 type transport system permease protein
LLRNAFGLAWRLDRGALVLWTVGLCLYGLLIGSIVHGIGDELGGDTAREIVVRMGGTQVVEQAFVAAAFCMLGMLAAAFAISLVLRLHQEEAGQRAETLLSGSVSRSRWVAGHLVLAVAGSALAIAVAGIAAGLTYGIASHDVGGKLLMVVGTALVQLPAVWLPPAVAVALFGLAPRFSPVAWGVLVGFVALYLIGELSGFPQWVLDTEPFAHIPLVTRDSFTPVPLLALLAVDAVLIALGMASFGRRDVQS